jgi:penicillin-binding protein 2
MAYRHRDHAWMTSWGMKDGKTYTVVVMVEHGGGGSSTAGPVAVKVYDALFGPVAGRAAPETMRNGESREQTEQGD